MKRRSRSLFLSLVTGGPNGKPSPALPDTRLVDAKLDALPGARRWPEAQKNGWLIKRTDGQIASGYVSDNALGDTSAGARGNPVELALNPEWLVEMPLERSALLRWLHYQRQCFGERKFNIHQRGPVTWLRMGFATLDEALIFLRNSRPNAPCEPRLRARALSGREISGSTRGPSPRGPSCAAA